MREVIKSGFTVQLKIYKIKTKHCLLPYHMVVKESISTIKYCIANNTFAKTSTGILLNN
jgi:hypothetical protein